MLANNKFTEPCVNKWRITISGLLVAYLLALLLGCVSSSNTPTLLLWEHQLVGKIWDVEQQAFIDKTALVNRALESEYLLLGERHDNLVHHQHQTWLVQQLAKTPLQVSVAFEMIDNYQGELLAKQKITSADQLIALLNHSKTNWDYERNYKSLFAEVLAAGYKIDMANLNKKRLMHTVKQGEDKLPAAYKRMLDKAPLSTEQFNALQQEINQSHCNMLDDKSSRKLVLGQRMRDAIMAHSLLRSRAPVKVLIAGNGHVRNDRGVPLYLRSNLDTQGKQARILSIGLLEVETGETDPLAYAELWGNNTLPLDIVWFTPQVKRDDPCVKLRQHFKSKS